ncbi:prosaposin [Drosophila pseudoobscura]|uniref:Prosaposin n=1 Tax=Drosophila pseudoobscura pseudoobscura TaxID=46245 RepID=A0A6I8VQ65_DROPS|nr:prosaposin [Drosophila pseudoobscura]XP_033232874.1 prosaposin [Drosophila pseudoobscura]
MRRAGLLAILAVCACGIASSSPVSGGAQQLVGASKCTWGPTYWCDNLSNSKECRATRHCIQTVWEKKVVPVDTDSICQICKDMVTQARDQLKSNETEEELKEVFEGSCKLIPIKPIQKECIKMADDFLPELVEALASQMNPDQVCSVAGLCNSASIDEKLKGAYKAALEGKVQEEDSSEEETSVILKPNQLSCGNCNLLSYMMHEKFEATNRDDMVEQLLHVCGSLSSFSDACANIVLSYFNEIYDHVRQHLNTDALCHVSGVCASRYHQHEEEKQAPEALVALDAGDDIPCALCEQLVKHLRDVLVANTTETEFKQVLEGFCKQSRGFKDECISIVDQYYDVIYNTLVNKLDANGACFLIGVCPKNAAGPHATPVAPIMPLLPAIEPAQVQVTITKLQKLGAHEPKFTQDQLIGMQLPIDHLMGAANPSLLVEGGELCTICEYLLHFIQETLATPATDDEIKHTVENMCTKFPKGVAGQCRNFVEMYGDAVIALLVQGLNPREVCPKLQMCPHNVDNKEDIEVFHPVPVTSGDQQDQPTCPLCLFAVEQAQIKIRDNKSKDNIKKVLAGLCVHLPSKLRSECVDFVNTYSNELIDLLITDFKPQEICVQLKLCPKTKNYLDDMGISMEDDESSSSEELFFNEVASLEQLPIEVVFERDYNGAPNCLICEELVKTVEKKMGKHPTKDSIKQALEQSCDKLKKPVASKCHKLIDKFGDQIADLLLKEMDPKLICAELGLCLFSELDDLEIDEALKYDVIALPQPADQLARLEESPKPKEPPTCVLCEFVMTKLEADLKNKTEQDDIKRAILAVCDHLPATVRKPCDTFVEGYAAAVIDLLSKVPPKEVCQKLQLCFSQVVTDEVIECGVCHGATQVLLPFLSARSKDTDVTTVEMTSVACENLPAKYYSICSKMISIYGNSFKHLSERPYVDQSHVCAEIGKCFDSEKSSLAFARISA